MLGLGISECANWWDVPGPQCSDADATDWLEKESHDRERIDLPPVQAEFAARILALGKPTAIFLLNGGALAPSPELLAAPNAALIEAFYPGARGAGARARHSARTTGGGACRTTYTQAWADANDMLEHDLAASARTYVRRGSADVLRPVRLRPLALRFALALHPVAGFNATRNATALRTDEDDDGGAELAFTVDVFNAGPALAGDGACSRTRGARGRRGRRGCSRRCPPNSCSASRACVTSRSARRRTSRSV